MNKDLTSSQLSRVLLMVSLNGFGLGLVSVFIPIYLLTSGYSFQSVMAFMVVQHVALLVMAFVAVLCANRIGLVHCLHVRFLILLAYLLLLYQLPQYPWIFFVIAALVGSEAAFYWMPLNILFVRNTSKAVMGGSLSKLFSYPQFLSMWSPLIGALLIKYLGFHGLFIIAMLIVFLIFTPLISMRSEKSGFSFSWTKTVEIWRANKRFFLPEIVDNFVEDTGVVLNIFIYLKLLSITELGVIGTITSVAIVLFTLTIGKLTDSWKRRKLFRIGAVLVSAAWAVNAYIGTFIPDVWLFYASTVFLSISLRSFLVPYQSLLFNAARSDDAQFLVLREVPVVLGRVILYTLAIFLANWLPLLFLISGTLYAYFWFVDIGRLERAEAAG